MKAGGLRDYQAPREDLPELAHGIAERPGRRRTHARRRLTQCSSCQWRCGDQDRSDMSESRRILTTRAARYGGG